MIQHQQDAERQRIHREEQMQATIQRRQHAEVVARVRKEKAKAMIQRRQHAKTVTRGRQQQRKGGTRKKDVIVETVLSDSSDDECVETFNENAEVRRNDFISNEPYDDFETALSGVNTQPVELFESEENDDFGSALSGVGTQPVGLLVCHNCHRSSCEPSVEMELNLNTYPIYRVVVTDVTVHPGGFRRKFSTI